MQFLSKTNYAVNTNISHKTDRISNAYNTKSLGLTLDSTLSWKPHIDQTYFQTEFTLLCN